MIECHAISGLAGQRHDGDRVPGGDAILLAAGFDDCEQLNFPRVPSASCSKRFAFPVANATGRAGVHHRSPSTKIQIGGSRNFGTGSTAANPAAKCPLNYQLPFRPGVYKAWRRLSTI
jgi:hypothetical protein